MMARAINFTLQEHVFVPAFNLPATGETERGVRGEIPLAERKAFQLDKPEKTLQGAQ